MKIYGVKKSFGQLYVKWVAFFTSYKAAKRYAEEYQKGSFDSFTVEEYWLRRIRE